MFLAPLRRGFLFPQDRILSRPGHANWQCLDDIRALHAGL